MTEQERKMSEDEAIYCLKAGSERYSHVCEECTLYGETGCDHCYNDANDVAIKALEEVQQYRALGTVEELRVARDKQVAKKLLNDGMRIPFSYYCPSCKEELSDDGYKPYDEYCCNCGQKLDWSDEDESET